MKKSISVKLFLITAAFMLIFLGGTFLLLTLFFQDFYQNKKVDQLESKLEDLSNTFEKNKYYNVDLTLPYAQLALQNTDSSSQTHGLISSVYEFKLRNNTEVGIVTNKGGNLRQEYLSYLYGGPKLNESQFVIRSLADQYVQQSDLSSLIGDIKSVKRIRFIDKEIDKKYIALVSPVKANGNTTEIIIAVYSLQPILESNSVIQEFYIYMCIGAGLLILVLSLMYSNMITKPLIKLNKTASKMAELDFSTKCDVKTEDELGNLGGTLNFLSENLYNALEGLRASNKKLTQDIEKERQLEKMRKEFVAGVSHELKTPIGIIEGYAEGLKDNIADDSSREFYLDIIVDEAKKMGTLVSDMLDLSQLETGNFKLKIREFSIDELISSVRVKFANMVQDKGIHLNVDLIENAMVKGDKFRIEQVLINFLSNAVKFTNPDDNIEVRMKDLDDKIMIEVENEGEQIAEKELKNIWDKFYKIDKSRNREAGGTGLGLAITKNILILHKSQFGVKNTEKGVKFYFTLDKVSEVEELDEMVSEVDKQEEQSTEE